MNRKLFAGSGTLLRFTLRRDRIRMMIWLIGLAAFAVMFVPVFENLLADGDGIGSFAAMMENPAMIAIVGPVYGINNYHTGAMYANMMLLFSVMIAAIMNIFLITRHTRQDEELRRLEVIRSLPVGRRANLSAAMLNALITNVLLTLICSLGMYLLRADGMTLSGCFLFGSALGVTGLFFAAAAAVFCQLTANNRTASALSLILMLVLYMMRAIGDLGTEALSLASPLGLVLRTKIFVFNHWAPIWIILIISAVLTIAAFALSDIRDLNRGLLPEHPGRRHASPLLSSSQGLAVKLLCSSLIIWGIVIFVLAGMYGSVFGDMEGFIESNEMVKAIFGGDAAVSMLEQFIVKLMAIMSMISAIPIISFVNRAAAEERHGFAEHILGKAVSRTEYLTSYLVPALVMSFILQLLSALGFWSVGSAVYDATPSLSTFTIAALAYLPAIWLFAGLALLLTAFLPGKTFIIYIYLGYSFISVYLGSMIGFPDWTNQITPFGVIPEYPVEKMSCPPLIAITAITIVVIIAAFTGYRKRNLQTS